MDIAMFCWKVKYVYIDKGPICESTSLQSGPLKQETSVVWLNVHFSFIRNGMMFQPSGPLQDQQS